MTRISLAEEYDNRDMVAQMIALKNRQTASEAALTGYVASCAQSASDAEDAKDAAVLAKDAAVSAKDTAVATVANCVTLNTAQTITAQKTFQDNPVVSNSTAPSLILQDPSQTQGTPPASDAYAVIRYADASKTNMGGISFYRSTTGGSMVYLSSIRNDAGGTETQMGVNDTGTSSYAFAPAPTAASPSDAITTVGYVSDTGGSLNNLLHTSGNETYTGTKQFASGGNFPVQSACKMSDIATGATNMSRQAIISELRAANGDVIAQLVMGRTSSGKSQIYVVLNDTAGNTKTVVLATND